MYNPRFEKDVFKRDVRNNVKTLFRKEVEEATPQQLFQAVSYAVKEAIIDDWLATQKQYEKLPGTTAAELPLLLPYGTMSLHCSVHLF